MRIEHDDNIFIMKKGSKISFSSLYENLDGKNQRIEDLDLSLSWRSIGTPVDLDLLVLFAQYMDGRYQSFEGSLVSHIVKDSMNVIQHSGDMVSDINFQGGANEHIRMKIDQIPTHFNRFFVLFSRKLQKNITDLIHLMSDIEEAQLEISFSERNRAAMGSIHYNLLSSVSINSTFHSAPTGVPNLCRCVAEFSKESPSDPWKIHIIDKEFTTLVHFLEQGQFFKDHDLSQILKNINFLD